MLPGHSHPTLAKWLVLSDVPQDLQIPNGVKSRGEILTPNFNAKWLRLSGVSQDLQIPNGVKSRGIPGPAIPNGVKSRGNGAKGNPKAKWARTSRGFRFASLTMCMRTQVQMGLSVCA